MVISVVYCRAFKDQSQWRLDKRDKYRHKQINKLVFHVYTQLVALPGLLGGGRMFDSETCAFSRQVVGLAQKRIKIPSLPGLWPGVTGPGGGGIFWA